MKKSSIQFWFYLKVFSKCDRMASWVSQYLITFQRYSGFWNMQMRMTYDVIYSQRLNKIHKMRNTLQITDRKCWNFAHEWQWRKYTPLCTVLCALLYTITSKRFIGMTKDKNKSADVVWYDMIWRAFDVIYSSVLDNNQWKCT